MARRLQAEQDPTSTMMGRCFGALIAKKLAADINSCHSSGVRGREAKLVSLSAILGRELERGVVENFLSQPGAIGLANIVSLMASSEMNTFITEKAPLEALDVFQETVDILLAKDFLTSLGAGLPQDLVDSFHGIYFNARQLQAPEWLMVGLGEIKKSIALCISCSVGDIDPTMVPTVSSASRRSKHGYIHTKNGSIMACRKYYGRRHRYNFGYGQRCTCVDTYRTC
ncbi:hypothetical protein EDB84DRAFT_1486200 [Lactarius hengduanensis]|nr:hypothetical protein EDB84DRAFT_1486200 [Lactarius hengduanensis]